MEGELELNIDLNKQIEGITKEEGK